MGVDLPQGAVVAQFCQLLGGQGFQLVFRNSVIFGDLLRRGRGAVGIARGEDGLAGVQQVQLVQQFDEGIGALALEFEIVAEFHRLFDVGGRLAVNEQRGRAAVPDERSVAIDAQDQPLLDLVIGKDERIAADIGRDVGLGAELAGVADKQVLAAAQGHDGDRHAGVADEDHRIGQRGRGELGHGQRDQIGLGHKTVRLVDGIDAQGAVGLNRQGLGLAVEQDIAGQTGGGGGVGHGRETCSADERWRVSSADTSGRQTGSPRRFQKR